MNESPAVTVTAAAESEPRTIRLDDSVELVPLQSQLEGQDYVLSCRGRNFAVSRRMAELVRMLQQEPSLPRLRQLVRERWRADVSEDDLEAIIRSNLASCIDGRAAATATTPQSRAADTGADPWAELILRVQVVPASFARTLSRALSVLYRPTVAWPLIVAATLCIGLALASGLQLRQALNAEHLLYGYAISLFITLFHELGHTTAYLRFYGRSAPICFGVYYVLPVMFVPLSHGYGGDRRERLLVDAGGLYFQLVLFIPLYLVSLLPGYPRPLYEAGLTVNTLILLFNLNPLFKLDGYFLLSSWLRVPNLQRTSMRMLLERTGLSRAHDSSGRLRRPSSATTIGLCAYAFVRTAALAAFVVFVLWNAPAMLRLLGELLADLVSLVKTAWLGHVTLELALLVLGCALKAALIAFVLRSAVVLLVQLVGPVRAALGRGARVQGARP
jgi:hypothetical protein